MTDHSKISTGRYTVGKEHSKISTGCIYRPFQIVIKISDTNQSKIIENINKMSNTDDSKILTLEQYVRYRPFQISTLNRMLDTDHSKYQKNVCGGPFHIINRISDTEHSKITAGYCLLVTVHSKIPTRCQCWTIPRYQNPLADLARCEV